MDDAQLLFGHSVHHRRTNPEGAFVLRYKVVCNRSSCGEDDTLLDQMCGQEVQVPGKDIGLLLSLVLFRLWDAGATTIHKFMEPAGDREFGAFVLNGVDSIEGHNTVAQSTGDWSFLTVDKVQIHQLDLDLTRAVCTGRSTLSACFVVVGHGTKVACTALIAHTWDFGANRVSVLVDAAQLDICLGAEAAGHEKFTGFVAHGVRVGHADEAFAAQRAFADSCRTGLAYDMDALWQVHNLACDG